VSRSRSRVLSRLTGVDRDRCDCFNLLDTEVGVVTSAEEVLLSGNCHRRLLCAPLVALSAGTAGTSRGAIVIKD